MNLSRLDVASIGINALFGGLLAGCYSLAMLYADRRSGALLSVHTDFLHVDRHVLSYCRELERRTKHVDAISFLQIIDAVDRIVGLRLRLQEDKTKITKKDEEEAFNQLARLHSTMRQLLQNCKTKMSIKEQVDLESLCTKLVEMGVDDHIKAITLMTKYAH